MTRAEVSPRGFSVDGAEPGWGAFATTRDPLMAAAWAFVAARNQRLARLDRSSLAALVAAHLALEADDWDASQQAGVVVVAVEDGSVAADREYWRTARVRGGAEASPLLFAATLPSTVGGELAITFGLRCACIVLAGAGSADADLAVAAHVGLPAGETRSGGLRLDLRLRGWRGTEDGFAVATTVLPGEGMQSAGVVVQ